jgi:ABC-2 type transport system permease protein
MYSGKVDSGLMLFCSFFPLSSPMAMFVRVAMGEVLVWEVVLSVVLLIATTVGLGILSARIYRVGVLLYGKPPRLSEVFKMLRQA